MSALEPVADRGRPRARHHLGTIVLCWAVQALVGLALSLPWVTTLDTWWGAHPDGDAALWIVGLPDVMELMTAAKMALRASTASTLGGMACWYLLSPLGVGAILAALADCPVALVPTRGEAADPAERISRLQRALWVGFRSWGRLAVVELVRLAAWIVSVLLLAVVPLYMVWASPEDRPMVWSIVATVGTLTALSVVGVVIEALADVVRAAIVSCDLQTATAFERVRARWVWVAARQGLLALPRWLAAAGLLGFGAHAAHHLPSLLVVALVHQLVSFGRVALRVSVLARSLWVSAQLPAVPVDAATLDPAPYAHADR